MSYRRAGVYCGVVLALAACFTLRVEACNTPVYRYAMDNWSAAPFEVYYFYRQKVAKEDEAVHRMLKDLSGAAPATVNLTLATVDVAKPRELDQVPAPVRDSWKSKHASTAPTYLIWSPWGAEVFAGRLDEAAVREMTDSPMRTRLGELLKQGNATVLLILTGTNEADTKRAQAVAKEVIGRGASGQIPVAGAAEPSPETPGSKPAGDDQPAASNRLELCQLTLSRSDPKERWLIRILSAVEPDLPQLAHEPMVFGVYGRGRAMQPFVGKGITADNLTELATFLAGACSCQVKDKNPGVDLLFHWDWNATADTLAAADPTRSGTQPAYQEFAADAMGEKPAALATHEPAKPAAPKDAPAEPGAGTPSEPLPKSTAVSPPDPPADHRLQEIAQAIASDENLGYDADRQMWKYGVAFALVTMLVVVTGLVLLRRQSP